MEIKTSLENEEKDKVLLKVFSLVRRLVLHKGVNHLSIDLSPLTIRDILTTNKNILRNTTHLDQNCTG